MWWHEFWTEVVRRAGPDSSLLSGTLSDELLHHGILSILQRLTFQTRKQTYLEFNCNLQNPPSEWTCSPPLGLPTMHHYCIFIPRAVCERTTLAAHWRVGLTFSVFNSTRICMIIFCRNKVRRTLPTQQKIPRHFPISLPPGLLCPKIALALGECLGMGTGEVEWSRDVRIIRHATWGLTIASRGMYKSWEEPLRRAQVLRSFFFFCQEAARKSWGEFEKESPAKSVHCWAGRSQTLERCNHLDDPKCWKCG